MSNIAKTIDYARRNGIPAALNAVRERIRDSREAYRYESPSAEELENQRTEMRRLAQEGYAPLISVVVPCHRTPRAFLEEMIASVEAQSYENHELILAGTFEGEPPAESPAADGAASGGKQAIRVLQLPPGGISDNTNAAVREAKGTYIALLDHDDVLAPDALYHMVRAVLRAGASGIRPVLVYSDEDKFSDSTRKDGKTVRRYFAPNRKPGYSYDYLLSNNYICHFTMVEAQMMKHLALRPAYDGAQDHDLFLRLAAETEREEQQRDPEGAIRRADKRFLHVPRVLYHWRSYSESTAESGANKSYAHDAGRRAVEAHLEERGIKCHIEQLPHRGFLKVCYDCDVFAARPDIGAVGAKLVDSRGRMAGGLYRKDGTIEFDGLPRGFSGGFTHRAVCAQDTAATDLIGIRIRPEIREMLPEELRTLVGSRELARMDRTQRIAQSLALCREIRRRGYRVLWDPDRVVRV